MSSPEQALASLLSQLALSFDGTVLGIALAYAAVRSLLKFSAVHNDRDSSSSQLSDHHHHHHHHQKLVVLPGKIKAKSTVNSSWKTFKPNVLSSQESGDKAVIVQ